MSTRIAVSVVKAAYLLLVAGMKPDHIETFLNNLNQPSLGHVYLSDLNLMELST